VHGFLYCGAAGAITGVGNALPKEVLRLVELCQKAVQGDSQAKTWAMELSDSLRVLSTFDEGPDLVLYYKRLMVLEGNPEYELQLMESDRLSESQRGFLDQQWSQFRTWWKNWPGA
jgi:4-hydroxy-tetrahydrodipicolinate synthase